MTNYQREDNDRIHAGFALVAGLLLDQYEELNDELPSSGKHEATLTFGAVHMLSTNMNEPSKRQGNVARCGRWRLRT